ncbi:MAG: NAD(P)-binding domain-containing protein [Gammaproteobacteria bacterium]|nr:NAD(P)-binding domain-containing protein [Gammaproteobacteria bacterium]
MRTSLPVVVIGAGPVGLAATAHLLARGLTPLVLEAGSSVGVGMLRWAHVRMFSPWEFTLDKAATALLARHGWTAPDSTCFPTGAEVVERYLRPLAGTPEIAPHLRLRARVIGIAKHRRDRMKDSQRNDVPFLVRYVDAEGEQEILAQAVIDASGTIESPNPLGASGLPALGEAAAHERIFYGMPDVLGAHRQRYAGKRVLVVGSGHSAFNVLNDLARLARDVPGTTIRWALRRTSLRRVLGGGENDQLQERGKLGLTIGRLVSDGALGVHIGFDLDRIEATAQGLVAHGSGDKVGPVDEIVAATGFRPDLALLSELRLGLDAGTQSPTALAPLIDPNLHSCGSVRPHGAEELKHPDANVYIVGMKSYGRAPTFLLLTGYEQVRSVVAAIAGDWESARRVELQLPETGVCITQFEDDAATLPSSAACCGTKPAATVEPAESMPVLAKTGCCGPSRHLREEPVPEATSEEPKQATACCGGPPLSNAQACCVKDEVAKAAGESGCGCSSTPTLTASTPPASASCGA